MSGLRWVGLLLAGLACFIVVGAGTAWLLLNYGQSLFPWHDTVAPEVLAGAAAGGVAGLAVIVAWGRRMRPGAVA